VTGILGKILAFLAALKKGSESREVAKVIPIKKLIDRPIAWHKSPNYSAMQHKKNTAIVLHHTASFNTKGDLRWMCNPQAKASAHYLIGLKGEIYQMVKDKDMAWHAGKSELDGQKHVNSFSIGIELTGNTCKKPLTPEQWESMIWLVRKLMDEHDIPAHRVVDHRKVSPGRKVDLDPKNFDWLAFAEEIG
jgi:N-acetylmuramoyl-L-alanine amidase